MIYLIGGAPRTGKTSLAKKLTEERAIPFVSTDFILHMVSDTLPQFKLLEPYSEISSKFSPYIGNLVKHISASIENYVVEGDVFSPVYVAELKKKYPVKACFLGFSKISIEEIVGNVGDNDWLADLSESERENLPQWIVKTSLNLKKECEKYEISYFDMAEGSYAYNLKKAYDYLVNL